MDLGQVRRDEEEGIVFPQSDLRAVNIWHDPDVSCSCVSDHNPNPTTFDRHHIIPLSWGGQDTKENTVIVCPSTHRNIHLLLTQWKKLEGEPPWSYRRFFGTYARDMAEMGWRRWFAEQEL